jgi:foldase protein PrsA
MPDNIPAVEAADHRSTASAVVTEKPAGRARRTAAPEQAAAAGRRGIPAVALVAVAFVLGTVLGAAIMRQRHNARDVVVAVNGTVLDKERFFRRLEMASGAQVMRQMVGEELQRQFAKRERALPTGPELEARYARLSKEPGFPKALAARGQTPADFKDALLLNMAQANLLTRGITVTAADVRRYYDVGASRSNPKGQYYIPETVQVAAIVTQTEGEAHKALAELNKGTSFDTVARERSKDRSKSRGGILPAIQRGRTKSAQVPGMESLLFGLRIGQQSGPHKLAGLWWIVRCLDKRPAVTRPFEQVKDECRLGAMLVKGIPANQKRLQADFESFQRTANVQAFWRQYKDVVKIDQ